MPTLPTLFRQLRLMAILLAVAVLGVRGAVPAGYMPGQAEDGRITIRLCGDGVGRLMQLDPVRGELTELPASPDDAGEDGVTCPYALTAAFDLPHTPPAAEPPAYFGLPRLGARPYARPLTERPALAPLPARGPPVLV